MKKFFSFLKEVGEFFTSLFDQIRFLVTRVYLEHKYWRLQGSVARLEQNRQRLLWQIEVLELQRLAYPERAQAIDLAIEKCRDCASIISELARISRLMLKDGHTALVLNRIS
jgi:hypothetical protein